MSPEDKAERAALFAQHIVPMAVTGASSSDMGRAWLDLVREAAEQAGREWAAQLLDEFVLAGASIDATGRRKAYERSLYSDSSGQVRSMSATRGTKRRNPDGTVYVQQQIWRFWTLQELRDHIAMLQAQEHVLHETILPLQRVESVYAAFPDAPDAETAMALAGTTIDAVLRAAS